MLEMQFLITHCGIYSMIQPMRFIRIVWDSLLILTLTSLVLERSRRNLPPTVWARRDWESTSLTFHLQPSEPVVSGEGDQTCGVTASPRRQAGGERSLCSFLCGNDKTTAEWTRPRNPVTSSREPAEKQRNHHDMIQKKEEKGKETIAPCGWKHLGVRTHVRQLDVWVNSRVTLRRFVHWRNCDYFQLDHVIVCVILCPALWKGWTQKYFADQWRLTFWKFPLGLIGMLD